MEGCINDALVGYCGTIGGDDDLVYSYVPVTKEACEAAGITRVHKNQQCFKVTFEDQSWRGACALSECSDHVDNDGDCKADFGGASGLPPDDACTDYDDDDESPVNSICN